MAQKLARYHYIERLVKRLEARVSELQKRNTRWSWARVLAFVLGVVLVVVSLFQFGQMVFWLTLGLTILVFGLIVTIHRKLEKSLARHLQWIALKERQLARMRLDWDSLPGPRAKPDFSHPYQGDLDLVGERSIACLIDLSFTEAGALRLREWLSGPIPPLPEIERRQRLVTELRSKHLLRMQLFANANQLDAGEEDASKPTWDSTRLEDWVKLLPHTARRGYLLWAGWLLAGLNLLLLAVDLLLGGPRLWPYSWGIYGFLILFGSTFGTSGGESRDVFDDALRLRKPFEQLVALFQRLEEYTYRGMPEFKVLCAPFVDPDHRPTHYLRRLVWIINATGMRGNPLIWLALNLLVPWDIQFTHMLEKCKADIAHYLPIWLDVWAEVETVNSLANLGYINPGYVMPSVIDNPSSSELLNGANPAAKDETGVHPLFFADELAHPLLPDVGLRENSIESSGVDGSELSTPVSMEKVSNDFVLSELGEVRLLTGSNMAGKSTFLRTLGVNMALAYAGGPVDASSLTLRRFRIFSSIKVTDSVTDGISYFYAEVKRLRLLLDALEDEDNLPVFFFIDEIYRGTNNRERLIGSRSYIRALAGMNGVGLISTHDLDLVTLADDTPQIKNYHFRDEVRNDRMHFDYKLRPGPCPTTNALKIMAMEGLPAGEDS